MLRRQRKPLGCRIIRRAQLLMGTWEALVAGFGDLDLCAVELKACLLA